MENIWKWKIAVLSFFLLATLLHGSVHPSTQKEREPYIVYMGKAPKSQTPHIEHHHRLLHDVIGDKDIAERSRIHSVGKSFNAFAANLLPHEAKRLQEREGVVSVFPSTIRQLSTTRSWDFMRMPLSVKRNSRVESDVIVGVFDTGIYMDAPSFNDEGFGPPPSKWKGTCQKAANFSGCNNKVIGATAYSLTRKLDGVAISPVDTDGHGTHTSSTVAGVEVPGASFYNIGKGTARGGVPSARLAIYKICWENEGCSDVDIMAAFDDAIDDGIDMISMSIGGPASKYFQDIVAIGAFHAMKKGIFLSLAGGNDGRLSMVQNVAPWIMTVGAAGTDRQYRTPLTLGNGQNMTGISISTFHLKKKMYPLITGKQASNNKRFEYSNAKFCDDETLDEKKVKGKIVVCEGPPISQDNYLKGLGAIGVLISDDQMPTTAFGYVVPTSVVNLKQVEEIYKYINSTKNPTATISKTIEVKVAAPYLAEYSSRGPNQISHTILKPDLVAPGTDILAAYTRYATPTGKSLDNRHDVYNIISGTSMATPHATAIAAYVKTFHPSWSPAAIKSALMTTAAPLKVPDPTGAVGSGAGHINPMAAVDPGLVYDLHEADYIRFLCLEGYTGSILQFVTDDVSKNCSNVGHFGGHDSLNYPTMYIEMKNPNATISATFNRIVTNVGPSESVYLARVKAEEGLKVTVSPSVLRFDRLYQKASFKVTVTGKPLGDLGVLRSASLEWVAAHSGQRVRSPIVAYTPEPIPWWIW